MKNTSDYSISSLQKACDRWRHCSHQKLIESFHVPFPDKDKRSPDWLYRKNSFFLEQGLEEFKEMIKVAEKLKVHMAIRKEKVNDSFTIEGFCPILELIPPPNQKKLMKVGLFPMSLHYPGRPQSSLDPTGKVPKAFKTQVCQRWLNLHPGFIADQFAILELPASGQNNESKKGDRFILEEALVCRKRVLNYTYDQNDVEDMKTKDFAQIFLHMGVNHNYDLEGEPSFIPVLQLVNGELLQNNGEGDDFYEYATPCPPHC